MEKFDNSSGYLSPKQITEQRERIIENWAKSGLLDGLKGINRSAISELLECKTGYAFRDGGDLISLSGI